MSQQDLQGETLTIGDRVAVSSGGRYHQFYIGIVGRFTAQKVGVVAEGREFKQSNERLIYSTSCVKIFKQSK